MFTPPNMSRVTCHVSRVTCHVSRVTCHISRVTYFLFLFFLIFFLFFIFYFFFLTNWWSSSVEGLSSTGLPRLFFISFIIYFSGIKIMLVSHFGTGFTTHLERSCLPRGKLPQGSSTVLCNLRCTL